MWWDTLSSCVFGWLRITAGAARGGVWTTSAWRSSVRAQRHRHRPRHLQLLLHRQLARQLLFHRRRQLQLQPRLLPHQHLQRRQQEHQQPPRHRLSISLLVCSFRLATTLASAGSSSREPLPSISSSAPSDLRSLSLAFPTRWLIRSWSCTVRAHLPPSPTTTGWTIPSRQLSFWPLASLRPTISNRRLTRP